MSAEPLEAARAAVAKSDRYQGTGAEMSGLRDALRALIQWAEEHEHPRIEPPLRSHASYLAEGCRCHKGFCAVHDR